MIATITRTWTTDRRATILAKDRTDGVEKLCYVWLPQGAAILHLCEAAEHNGHPEAKERLVLTVEPKTAWGYQIIAAEPLPDDRVSTWIHEESAPAAVDARHVRGLEVLHGKREV